MKKNITLLLSLVVFVAGFYSCSNVYDEPLPNADGENGTALPYEESFESDMGRFTAVSVVGDEAWKMDFKHQCVVMNGSEKIGDKQYEKHENEDWLISPAINLTDVKAAKFSFDHLVRYFYQSISESATIWVSENYTSGNPSEATWTQITTNFSDFSDWNYQPAGEFSLTPFAGKSIRIAFKYTSTTQTAGTWQIKNFKVEQGEASTTSDNTDEGDAVKKLPYTESFASTFGAFSTENVKGEQIWTLDAQHHNAVISGSVKVEDKFQKFENEDWLISPAIDLTKEKTAKFTFEHIVRYFYASKGATIWVSEDYKAGAPSSAQWTEIKTEFKDFTEWKSKSAGEFSLTPFVGKTIRIAFKYTSTTEAAGTWQIKNFKVEKGEASSTPDTPNGGETQGDSSEANPYNVDAAKANQGQSAWVKGYIVGAVKAKKLQEADFNAPFSSATNVLLAMTPDETNPKNCLPIQLPFGKIRELVNLKDNEGNHKKEVLLYGSLVKYFGVPGMKETKYAQIEGQEAGNKPGESSTEEPNTEEPAGNFYFSEKINTQASFDKFTNVTVKGESFSWFFHEKFKVAAVSAYKDGTSHASEIWLITPAINLNGKSSVKLSFDQTRGPNPDAGVKEGFYKVFVSKNYTAGDPNSATWVEITGINNELPKKWAIVNSGELEVPASELSASTRIAFKYQSTNEISATWQIKNVIVK